MNFLTSFMSKVEVNGRVCIALHDCHQCKRNQKKKNFQSEPLVCVSFEFIFSFTLLCIIMVSENSAELCKINPVKSC